LEKKASKKEENNTNTFNKSKGHVGKDKFRKNSTLSGFSE
jgi:hypothetical protein